MSFTKKDKHVGVKFSHDDLDALRKAAISQDTTISQYIRKLMRKQLREDGFLEEPTITICRDDVNRE